MERSDGFSIQRRTVDFVALAVFWALFSWMTLVVADLLLPILGVDVQHYFLELYLGLLLVGLIWYVFITSR